MNADEPDDAAPAAIVPDVAVGPRASATGVRRFSVRTRVAAVAVAGVVVIAALAIVSAVGVSTAADAAHRADDLARAGELNARAADSVRDVHDLVAGGGDDVIDVDSLDGFADRAEAVAPEVAPLLHGVGLDLERTAVSADARALQAARALATVTAAGEAPEAAQEEERSAFAAAATARSDLADTIDARRLAWLAKVGDERDRTITIVVVVAVLGALLVAGVALVAVRSVVGPIRLLGRSMRRFADGDLRARGVDAPDEIGTLARSFNLAAGSLAGRVRDLTATAERGTQLRIIAEALDLALDENDVHRIVEHAMGIVAPGRPLELLLTTPDSTSLRQVAVNPNGGAPNCPVEETSGCVAIRRASTMTFQNPDEINSCPMLRERPTGPCSAVCVPVNAGGVLVGVVHATGPVGDPPPPATTDQLVTLASQTGARIGSMRTLESTRVEATTDGLTGVANRRMLNATLADLLRTSTPFVLVVADLDRFKALNDTYGHETGDRALQLFAQVLQGNVRGRDLVARYGGEEFVLVYPEMNVSLSMEVLERIRSALSEAVAEANIPPFTASYGVTHSSVGTDVETIVRTADAGLLMAKDLGRDRVVYSDAELAAEIFSNRADDPPAPTRD